MPMNFTAGQVLVSICWRLILLSHFGEIDVKTLNLMFATKYSSSQQNVFRLNTMAKEVGVYIGLHYGSYMGTISLSHH